MLRPRARVGHAHAASPLRGLVPGLLVALLLPLTACGSSSDEGAGKPSKAALSCREQWRDLEAEIEARDSMTNPSALAARWNTIAATLTYYATSATASDCGETLKAQEKAMDDLAAFATRLAPYDMELHLEEVTSDAEAYAAAPAPPAPSPSPTKKGKKPKKVPAPPSPAAVAVAIKTFTAQAPLSTQQQGPAWQQALVADLANTAALTKAVKDLAFLSSESPAYVACATALRQIRVALAAS